VVAAKDMQTTDFIKGSCVKAPPTESVNKIMQLPSFDTIRSYALFTTNQEFNGRSNFCTGGCSQLVKQEGR
jgi:hypothetical protein